MTLLTAYLVVWDGDLAVSEYEGRFMNLDHGKIPLIMVRLATRS